MKNIPTDIVGGSGSIVSSHAGFLPVPLRCVPCGSLSDLEVYIYNPQTQVYSLYRHRKLPFGEKDYQRLLDSQIETVYVSIKDHDIYYHAMENAIGNIIGDPKLQKEKKAEILYSTSLELANQLLEKPPDNQTIARTGNIAQATVQMIMGDKKAFGSLFEISNHDFYTATHTVNVCSMCVMLAIKLGITDQKVLQYVGTGGLLHDIGKVFIPTEILNTKEKLNEQQYKLMQNHVQLGRDHLLEAVPNMPREVIDIVSEHHERIDGSGYPLALKGDEISLMGRLAAVVDTFDAMISVRPYRDYSFSVGDALDFLEHGGKKQYDAEIVHSFSQFIESTINDIQSKTETDTKDIDGVFVEKESPKDVSELHSVTQYYFRIPVIIRNICKVGGQVQKGPEEKMIAHKICCDTIGFLSPRSFAVNQLIYITSNLFEKIRLTALVAVVLGCKAHGDGWFSVEAKFIKRQDPAMLCKIRELTSVSEITEIKATMPILHGNS